jgi:hypothetical protein
MARRGHGEHRTPSWHAVNAGSVRESTANVRRAATDSVKLASNSLPARSDSSISRAERALTSDQETTLGARTLAPSRTGARPNPRKTADRSGPRAGQQHGGAPKVARRARHAARRAQIRSRARALLSRTRGKYFRPTGMRESNYVRRPGRGRGRSGTPSASAAQALARHLGTARREEQPKPSSVDVPPHDPFGGPDRRPERVALTSGPANPWSARAPSDHHDRPASAGRRTNPVPKEQLRHRAVLAAWNVREHSSRTATGGRRPAATPLR